MTFEFWGLGGKFYLELPQRLAGYLLLALASAVIFVLAAGHAARAGRRHPKTRPRADQSLLFLLLLTSPIAAQLLLVRVVFPQGLPCPGTPIVSQGPAFSVLGAVPWMLATGILGTWHAAVVGLVGGLARAGWETHSWITVFQPAIQAALVAYLIRLKWRELPGRVARNPLAAATLSGLFAGVLHAGILFTTSQADGFDAAAYAFSWLPAATMAHGVEAVVGGVVCLVVKRVASQTWHRPPILLRGPYARSLEGRVLFFTVPVVLLAGTALLVGSWQGARSAARENASAHMARSAAEMEGALVSFVEAGRGRIRFIARQLGFNLPTSSFLAEPVGEVPFFDGLILVDPQRTILASEGTPARARLSQEVDQALELALAGIPSETLEPGLDGQADVHLVFVAPIIQAGQTVPAAAVAGWANPESAGGQARPTAEVVFVVDGQDKIVIHPDPRSLMSVFRGGLSKQGSAHVGIAPDGTQRLTLIKPMEGYPWRVVSVEPLREVYRTAFQSTLQILCGFIVTAGVLLGGVHLILREHGRRLRTLERAMRAVPETSIAPGSPAAGEDEIGRMFAVVQEARRSFQARLSETGLMAGIGERIAAAAEPREAISWVLEELLAATRADFVRLVIEPTCVERTGLPDAFQAGRDPGGWSRLDGQMLDLCKTRGRLILENPARAKPVLNLEGLTEPIAALIALPLSEAKDGAGLLWLAYRAPHVFADGEVAQLGRVVSSLSNLTAVAARLALADRVRLQSKALLDAVPMGLITLDSHRKASYANPAASRLLSESPERIIGRTLRQVVAIPEVVEALEARPGAGHAEEVSLKDGRALQVAVSDVVTQQGEFLGQVLLVRDVTEEKALEGARTDFVATAAHDLRVPLEQMRGYVRILSAVGSLSDQQAELIRKTVVSIERMDELISNLLDVERLESGPPLRLGRVDVGGLLEEVVASFMPQARARQLELALSGVLPMPEIEADRALLRQAVANLVDNAIKFTKSGGRVAVGASQSQGEVKITVADTGQGIASPDLAALLAEGRRAGSGSVAGRKKGMGVAIVQSVAERHGGRVTGESRLGAGSRFAIVIPLRKEGIVDNG